ncbi:MAG: hypothetical protein A2X36_08060 [Elusimicrobia bacterium GWA2_69_24]|nr:MAG: hypothetical protein A2X36_08060 [Elusimicrobia bacterium GWA2_69_24]HBL17444.1 radical SAM protein [Elusimicrobiota bacterium]
MKLLLIAPSWTKLPEQTPFLLPSLGPIQVASCAPPGVSVSVVNENVSPVDFDRACDLVGISVLLTCQAPRAYALADEFRRRGKTVVLGGFHVSLCPEEAAAHADAVVVGEAEGQLPRLLSDFAAGRLQPVYRRDGWADPGAIPAPRRDLYDKKLHYTYKGWELADLLESSRGCRSRCFPCGVPGVCGSEHRIRPLDAVLADVRGCSDLVFLVDNSLEQNIAYERELLRALRGEKRRWISHPLTPDPEILSLAREAGWLYVYHEIHGVSDTIRERVRRYHDHGIAVEGAVFIGLDDHDESAIRRLVDFTLEIGLDLVEYTILTPFPGSPVARDLEAAGRILHKDWSLYNAANVVFRPRLLSPERLQELYFEAWRTFYAERSHAVRMSRLFLDVVHGPARRRPRRTG